MSALTDFAGSLFGSAAGAGLFASAYGDLQNIGDEAKAGAMDIAREASDRSGFTPFGVTTSGLGGIQTDAAGGTAFNLSDPQRALQDMYSGLAQTGGGQFDFGALTQNRNTAFGQAQGMLSGLDQSTAGREADVYERIRATQRPGEARQRAEMEERLYAQGRGRVSTNLYGGTPEQLAMEKAQAEARNTASLSAIQQAQSEQNQQYTQGMGLSQLGMSNMGQGVSMANTALTSQYAPMASLMSALSPATNVASLADAGRRQAAEIYGTAGMSGIEAQLGANLGGANLLGNLGAGLFSGSFNPSVTENGQVVGGLFNTLGNLFS